MAGWCFIIVDSADLPDPGAALSSSSLPFIKCYPFSYKRGAKS